MIHEPVQDAGAVEPGRDREPPGYGGGFEPADLLHPPDVQLQVRAPRDERVHAVFGAPVQVAAQVGLGVLTGGALEAGEVGGHCEPQPVSKWLRWIGRIEDQLSECRHAMTLRGAAVTVKLTTRTCR